MFNSNFEDIIDFIVNRKVDYMDIKLNEAQFISEEIKEGQQNNRYSKIISALTDIEQSLLEKNEQRKIFIQIIAQTKLNEGIDSILREFINKITFFVLWDERKFTERVFGSPVYSEKNIERNLNQLCEDYVYLKKGIKTLIDLKVSQGIEKEKLKDLIDKLNGLDELIEKNKIYNWLPIEDEMNSWQHKLLYGRKYDERFSKSYYDNLENSNIDITNRFQKGFNCKKNLIRELVTIWRKG